MKIDLGEVGMLTKFKPKKKKKKKRKPFCIIHMHFWGNIFTLKIPEELSYPAGKIIKINKYQQQS